MEEGENGRKRKKEKKDGIGRRGGKDPFGAFIARKMRGEGRAGESFFGIDGEDLNSSDGLQQQERGGGRGKEAKSGWG